MSPRNSVRSAFRVLAWMAAVPAALCCVCVAAVKLAPRPEVRLPGPGWPAATAQASADSMAADVLGRMTLEEKIAQLSGDGGAWTLARLGVGFLVLREFPLVGSGRNDRLGVPPFTFTDGPRGVIVGRATGFPIAMARAAAWNRDLQAGVGDAIGREARALGANYFGGVCVNLLRHPAWGRAQATYGEDPFLTAEMAVPLLRSVQAHNVMACVKHFALNSIENSRFRVSVEADDRTLREVYLPQFRKCVEAGAASVMSAYNRIRGEYCGQSRFLLTDILRGEWGFGGFVTSDWFYGVADGAKAANAGMDVEMPIAVRYGNKLEAAVRSGAVPAAAVDSMACRVLRTKLLYAGRKDPMSYPDSLVACAAHRALARRAAEEGMVLLRNRGAALPFPRAGVKSLAVIGPLADEENTGDRGSSWVRPPHVVTFAEGLRAFLGDSVKVLSVDGADTSLAKRLARAVDAVVLVAGYRFDDEGENLSAKPRTAANSGWGTGGDRTSLSLKPADIALLRAVAPANPACAAVIVAGSAVTIEEWKDAVPSILLAWYPGMEGGTALARVLFGEVNPSGKLPFTIQKSESQLPPFDFLADTVRYGPYHGYTLLDRSGQEPAFAFGYGLSYTTFSHSRPRVLTPVVRRNGTLLVEADVTDTRPLPGAEVVQLYVGFGRSRVDRPKKLLRGFEKVVLAPGETRTVRFSVPAKDLAWYDPVRKGWDIEEMIYEVYTGSSSAAADLSAGTFRVTR